jgi:hypothetical protein
MATWIRSLVAFSYIAGYSGLMEIQPILTNQSFWNNLYETPSFDVFDQLPYIDRVSYCWVSENQGG